MSTENDTFSLGILSETCYFIEQNKIQKPTMVAAEKWSCKNIRNHGFSIIILSYFPLSLLFLKKKILTAFSPFWLKIESEVVEEWKMKRN